MGSLEKATLSHCGFCFYQNYLFILSPLIRDPIGAACRISMTPARWGDPTAHCIATVPSWVTRPLCCFLPLFSKYSKAKVHNNVRNTAFPPPKLNHLVISNNSGYVLCCEAVFPRQRPQT